MRRLILLVTFLLSLCVITDAEAKKKKFKDGSIYEGEIVKGVISGLGTMTYANGDVYNGTWSDGKQSGSGVMSYANGDKYDGAWGGGLINGEGVMVYSIGDKYSGFWYDGKYSNKGIMTYANGDRYSGSWSDGERSGDGVMKYANGDMYNGKWQADKCHGDGVYTFKNGDKYSGVWANGTQSDSGKMIYTNGDTYDGNWKSGKHNGSGEFISTAGYSQNGEWENGDFINGVMIVTSCEDYAKPDGFISLNHTISNGEIVADEIAYTYNFNYKGDVYKFFREGTGTYCYSKSGFKLEMTGVWQGDKLVKGAGVMSGCEMGDKFEISSNDGSEGGFNLSVSANGKIIYSDKLYIPLNDICSEILSNIKGVLEKKERQAYYDKYLENNAFYIHTSVNDHPTLNSVGAFLDVAAISIFEYVIFEDCNTVKTKRISYIDKRRIKSHDRGYLLQQTMIAQELMEKERSHSFKYEDGYLIFDDTKYKYNPADKSLYDEEDNIKYKLATDPSLFKNIFRNALGM